MVQPDDLIKEKIKFATFVNQQNLQLIGSVDQKTSIIVAINGAILGLLAPPIATSTSVVEQPESIPSFIFLCSTVLLLGASAIFGVRTLLPRIDKAGPYSDSFVFHETIVKELVKDTDQELISKKFRQYKDKLDNLTPEDILYQETLNAFRLAYALKSRHFKYLRRSLWLLFSGLIPLILFLLSIMVSAFT
jgi:hypothetical protein